LEIFGCGDLISCSVFGEGTMKPWSYRNSWLRKVFRDSKGQTLVEYGLLLVLIAVIVIAAIGIVGSKANNTFSTVGNSMPVPP
jgi:pilus assembly protein Flp/PilA